MSAIRLRQHFIVRFLMEAEKLTKKLTKKLTSELTIEWTTRALKFIIKSVP